MGTAMTAACWGLTLLAGVIQEPKTRVEFADSMQAAKGTVACTGVTYRSKFMVKVYAIAHYGDPAAAPSGGTPAERLKHWTDAKALKVFVLKFTYGIDAQKMREACDEGMDNANFHGKNRDAFLNTLQGEFKKGDEFRLIAQADGTLTAQHNDKVIGSWQDADLVKALWGIWMGEKSPLADREKLVAK